MGIRLKIHSVITFLLLFILIAPGVQAEPENPSEQPPQPAKNIILLIGDGMSMEVISLMRDYARVVENRELCLEGEMNHGSLALVDPTPVDKLVIDSSAAATALATGTKTINGMVSMTPDGRSLPTLADFAKKASRSVGIITTTTVSHATPACFAAHALERNSEAEIARQMEGAGLDVLMGGGLIYWIPEGHKVSEFARITSPAGADAESRREDAVNLLDRASGAGFRIVCNRDELLAARGASKILGLFAASHLPYALDRMPDDAVNVPSLAEMTQVALEILSKNDNGFFLMVEGGRIDHAAHSHDVAAMITDAMDFDKAIGAAHAFAQTHPQTAIFITADHATAAPALSARYSDETGETLYPDEETIRKIARQDASFEYLLFALGKNRSPEKLKSLISEHCGIDISRAQASEILTAGPLTPFYVIKPKYRKFGYPILAMGRILGVQYATAWATAEHYAEPTVFISSGSAQDTRGYLEQTDVFKIIKSAGGL